MKSKHFYEKKGFRQWWLWLVLAGLFSVLLYFNISHFIFDKPLGNNPASDTVQIIINISMILLMLFILMIRLETNIDPTGISYRFYPLHLKFRQLNWNAIEKCYIREYKAIKEYGGWGIRYGKQGKAYTIGGRYGIQIELKNAGKLLIGVEKKKEAEEVLNYYMLQNPSVSDQEQIFQHKGDHQ